MTIDFLQSTTFFLYTTTSVSFCWQYWSQLFSCIHLGRIHFLSIVVCLLRYGRWSIFDYRAVISQGGARRSLFTIFCSLRYSRSPMDRGRPDLGRFSFKLKDNKRSYVNTVQKRFLKTIWKARMRIFKGFEMYGYLWNKCFIINRSRKNKTLIRFF